MNPEKILWNRDQCQNMVGLQYYQTQNSETWGKILKKIPILQTTSEWSASIGAKIPI